MCQTSKTPISRLSISGMLQNRKIIGQRVLKVQQYTDAYEMASACASEKSFLARLHQINTTALISLATRLRNGIPCSIPGLALDDEGYLDPKPLKS